MPVPNLSQFKSYDLLVRPLIKISTSCYKAEYLLGNKMMIYFYVLDALAKFRPEMIKM